jgi:hypothetical protein
VLLEAWEAGEPEESPADIVVNRFVWLLQWATQNAGQRYRLKKAAAAWLAENDDGKEKLDVLAERFVATHDIDAIVARPKHPITAVATGHNVVLFFRGEETPDYTLVVKREETMRWAQCLLDIREATRRSARPRPKPACYPTFSGKCLTRTTIKLSKTAACLTS